MIALAVFLYLGPEVIFKLSGTNGFRKWATVTDEKEVADICLEYFDNIVLSWGLQVLTELVTPTDNPDPLKML